MRRDLGFLQRPLTVAATPGLEAVDPRLAALTDLAEKGQYAEAANRVEELFADGIYDIRAFSYYLFQAFLEGGLPALVDILDGLPSLFGENFVAIGPVKKREEHFDKRLAWLLETLEETIEYHEAKQTAEWSTWQQGVTVESLERALRGADALSKKLPANGFANTMRGLGRLTNWLVQHAGAIAEPAPKSRRLGTVPPSVPPPPGSEPRLSVGELPGSESLDRIEIAVSRQFLELSHKLRAFDLLISQGNHEKAAVVADDLMHLIERFDPRAYFPELFVRFSALFSENIGLLEQHWERRETMAWKALDQYYRIDLKKFVAN